MEQVAMMCI